MAEVPGPALLFVPGDRRDRFAKAVARADGVVLDLEDAVAPEHKDAARAHVVAALATAPPTVLVRVNGAGTPEHAADVAALAAYPGTVLVLPKATTAQQVAALAPHPVLALCESAAGVLAAPELARADGCVGLALGGEDLLADLGGRPGRRDGRLPPVLEHARHVVLLAARAAGLPAVDTVVTDLADLDALRTDAQDAAAAGFTAKLCVHPDQVAVVRAAFAPTEAELAWALEVLAAAQHAPAVFRHRGRMVDAPVLAHARTVLAAGAGARRPSAVDPGAGRPS